MEVEFVIAPEPINNRNYKDSLKIFLAGTIDMGESEDWQSKAIKYLIEYQTRYRRDITIFNPRRESWDSTWEQSIENPYFYQQVNWELNALEKSDVIVVNILPESKSPITLLEIGLYAKSKKILICCPKGFYRRGNIEIICDRYDIPLYEDIEVLLRSIK